MNKTDEYLKWVQERGGEVTLGDILSSPMGWAAEYRRFHSELRQKGYEVTVKLNRKEPGRNVYTIRDQVKYKYENNGQAVFA